MHGIRRVLVFCTLTTVLPTMLLIIPLYLRHSFYANVAYAVTESDIMEVSDGVSTVFCSEHTLKMNGTFNAFQMAQKPEITSFRKHIRLKKSMNLPDDTLEYWGFYLLKGATVALSVCSRFQGASILVVKGERNLRTCGMLEHNINKGRSTGIFLPEANQQVKITFESNAQEIISNEYPLPYLNNSHNTLRQHKNIVIEQKINKTIHHTNLHNMSLGNENDTLQIDGRNINKELATLFHTAETYVEKHNELEHTKKNTRKLRHVRKRLHRVQIEQKRKQKEKEGYEKKLKVLLYQNTLNKKVYGKKSDGSEECSTEAYNTMQKKNLKSKTTHLKRKSVSANDKVKMKNTTFINRIKRNEEPMKLPSLLDQGIRHGGNADRNGTDSNDMSSVSSFENGLLNCYEGSVLLAEEFQPSDQCVNVSYLINGKHIQTKHDVIEDGYYYYIFYSDNDFVSNDIHAVFDIYKPTFQYENVTKSCLNRTECTFPLAIMSSNRVIVEIPTKDGIDHGKDNSNLLVSICHPRMGAYVIFPITVMFLILGCAFI